MIRIRRVLVANRGEIAVRIMRTAHRLGISTVAVYTLADSDAPHVRMADMSVLIGDGPASESYLVGEKIIDATVSSGADAIHPGYGFLSENADFARLVEASGFIFIGPTASAIEVMGDKAVAKKRMLTTTVPCIPGYEGDNQSDSVLFSQGRKIGFPLMVKAAAGGGGRGMRLVGSAADLGNAITVARSEATSAFGSGDMILEQAIIEPRHVEIQVFADTHGNVIHLGERDCSVQRRHQKVIEESPCPVMTPKLRAAMGDAAVEAARAIDYRGAGTVEFLLDSKGKFYFLEMNTRLQVEHPVTEAVTGLDLVELQFRVAEGAPLPLTQDEVVLEGHAIEVRLYAEDPYRDFLPCTGRVVRFIPPHGDGVRIDTGVSGGQDISPFYDPMIAKIITYGDCREVALARMDRALCETVLFGIPTNRDFLRDCLSRESFVAGDFSTGFIVQEFGDGTISVPTLMPKHIVLMGIRYYIAVRDAMRARAVSFLVPSLVNFSTGADLRSLYRLDFGDDQIFDLIICSTGVDDYRVEVSDVSYTACVRKTDGDNMVINLDGRDYMSVVTYDSGILYGLIDGQNLQCVDLFARTTRTSDAADGRIVTAPLHGRVVDIFVKSGEIVSTGTRLAVIEAMKMQHEIISQIDGIVDKTLVEADMQVGSGDTLLTITTKEDL